MLNHPPFCSRRCRILGDQSWHLEPWWLHLHWDILSSVVLLGMHRHPCMVRLDSNSNKKKNKRFINGIHLPKNEKVESRFLTCLCHKIYRVEALGLKSFNYTFKVKIFVSMWNLGQFCEKLIFLSSNFLSNSIQSHTSLLDIPIKSDILIKKTCSTGKRDPNFEFGRFSFFLFEFAKIMLLFFLLFFSWNILIWDFGWKFVKTSQNIF